MIELIHGDSLIALTKIEENSIDLTVTSPPYDNLRTYNGNNAQWGESVWKSVIEELYKVTKEGGVVVWVVGDATIKGSETGTSFKQALWAMECGFNLHDTMIYKTNKPPMNDRRYQSCYEYMFILSKGKLNTFNGIRTNSIHPNVKNSGGHRKTTGETTITRRKNNRTAPTKIKENIWYLPRSSRSGDEYSRKHPATFPEQLAHDHIISWSNKGDIVLDPFMGSGTTGKMAKQLGRNFIGIELDKDYYEIAKKRIGL